MSRPKFDITQAYPRTWDEFRRTVWPWFLDQVFTLGQQVNSRIEVRNFTTTTQKLIGSNSIPPIFLPFVLSSTAGPNGDGWVFFSSSDGMSINTDITVNRADVTFAERLSAGGTIFIKNVTRGTIGSMAIPAAGYAFSGLRISDVSFTRGESLALKADGAMFGSGVWINLYGV